ncbi:MAG: diguanylate cyclase [Thermoanaerobaculia bacterium]
MENERGVIGTPAVVLAIAAVLFAATAALSLLSLRSGSGDSQWVDHTHRVLEELGTTLQLAADARHGGLAFALTGEEQRLEMVRRSMTSERSSVERVALLTSDNARQQNRLPELRRLVEAEVAWQKSLLRSRSRVIARGALESSASVRRYERLQQLIGEMKNEEQALLRQRAERQRQSVRQTIAVEIAGDLVIVALVLAAALMNRRATSARAQAEQRLAASNVEIQQRLADLQQRSAELSMLGYLAENLQTCEGNADVDRVVDTIVPRLFPGSRGAVFLAVRSTEIIPQTVWPPDSKAEFQAFHWQDCLGLSRFTLHRAGQPGTPECPHAPLTENESAICVPMIARGEPIGLLHVRWSDPHLRVEELVRTVAEQLGMAYANLSLHETLRRQAVRDPLTGVFNRRYMEESLEREIHRATRHNKPLSVLLVDLDRFKEFNDALGHAAGDELLRDLGGIMERMVRAEDIVCRYGGDEFVIIMPDAAANVAAVRAQSLMEQVGERSLRSGSGIPVTMSIGIAVFPQDGSDPRTLLKAADDALYAVKRGGRGRVLHA